MIGLTTADEPLTGSDRPKLVAAREIMTSVIVMIVFTVLLGLGYPTLIWAIGRLDSHAAEGSPVRVNGCTVGSQLIGVDPQVKPGVPDPYLHARVVGSSQSPTAPGDPALSGPSNLGPANPQLATWVTARRNVIAQREGVAASQVPADAVTGSGSGLDPDISPAYAALQVPRIARITGRSPAGVQAIIAAHTSQREWGFLGQPRVNVLAVNTALGFGCGHTP